MRITGGVARGRRIKKPKGSSTRPLLSRVRKSLFDIIGDKIQGSIFLDLYAGSGAVGIGSLSRGAKKAVFVEEDSLCIRIIRENLVSSGLSARSRVWSKDVFKFLPLLLREEKFHFIFVGPPYYKGMQKRTLDILEKMDLQGTILIIQHSPKEKINFVRKNIKLIKQKKYGDTILTFLQKVENAK